MSQNPIHNFCCPGSWVAGGSSVQAWAGLLQLSQAEGFHSSSSHLAAAAKLPPLQHSAQQLPLLIQIVGDGAIDK